MSPNELARPGQGSRTHRLALAAERDEDGTATRILDAAEQLFAERGYSAVSMRLITSESGVNLAAANYHFGTKARLFEEVFARRIVPINERRILLLNERMAVSQPSDTRLRAMVDAYVRPLLTCGGGDPNCDAIVVMKFLGKVLMDLTEHPHLVTYYDTVRKGFIDAIQQCLPNLSMDDTVFCYNSMVAVLLFYALGDLAHMLRPPNPDEVTAAASPDMETAIGMLCAFVCDGMPAAVSDRTNASL
jgi:AcrR family transcriptional regulator